MKIRHSLLFIVSMLWIQAAQAQDTLKSDSDVLQPANHPATPQYNSVFSTSPEQIDKKISWTKRFKGDARFNTPQDVVVGSQNPPADSSVVTGNAAYDGEGVVKKIDPVSQKLKIAHGPIASMGMPGMTMIFKVSDPEMLRAVEVGESIGFNVSDSDEGFLITKLASLSASPTATAADGRGVVKSVRNGKVKLKHGPIEKFGMPGMTMMFKAKDPKMLENLVPGVEVEFDVDNTDGGFIITRIKTAN